MEREAGCVWEQGQVGAHTDKLEPQEDNWNLWDKLELASIFHHLQSQYHESGAGQCGKAGVFITKVHMVLLCALEQLKGQILGELETGWVELLHHTNEATSRSARTCTRCHNDCSLALTFNSGRKYGYCLTSTSHIKCFLWPALIQNRIRKGIWGNIILV